MSKKKEITAYQFTLTTKKKIVIREGEIGDMERAAQIAGSEAGDNQAHMAMVMKREMVKGLLVSVDGKDLGLAEKQDLQGLFNLKEYTQVMKAIDMVTGDLGGGEGNLEMELVTA